MILISACLCGLKTNYKAASKSREIFKRLLESGEALPFCPEQLGGLPTPRQASEIIGGNGFDVINKNAEVLFKDGKNVTENFLRGAYEALYLAKSVKAEKIILKEKSPSCGVKLIHDGTFTGSLISGAGVTAALLKSEGFIIVSDLDFISSL